MLPSATGISGCSSTVGAIPNRACSRRLTSGIREAPPTRNNPARAVGSEPDCWITRCVSETARSSNGAANCSNSSRVRCSDASTLGTGIGATVVRDSISLAPRTSSQNSRRLRRSVPVTG